MAGYVKPGVPILLQSSYKDHYAQDYVWGTWTNTTSTTAASWNITANWGVQDRVWNNWTTAGNNEYRYYSTTATTTMNYWTSPVQERVWQRWQVHDRPIRAEEPPERQVRLDREQAAREEAARARLARQKKVAGAQERATELLRAVLPADQLVELDRDGRITVHGSDGGLYQLDTRYGGVHGNIVKVDEHGCALGRLCVAPGMYDQGEALPLADGHVGQYLGLRFNEREFVAKANWSQQRACHRPNVPILGQHRSERAA